MATSAIPSRIRPLTVASVTLPAVDATDPRRVAQRVGWSSLVSLRSPTVSVTRMSDCACAVNPPEPPVLLLIRTGEPATPIPPAAADRSIALPEISEEASLAAMPFAAMIPTSSVAPAWIVPKTRELLALSVETATRAMLPPAVTSR